MGRDRRRMNIVDVEKLGWGVIEQSKHTELIAKKGNWSQVIYISFNKARGRTQACIIS